MSIVEIPTITATIYIGLRIHYSNEVLKFDLARKICQDYVNDVGLCVTLTKTEYIYTNGNEPGLIIGLINYPRFPSDFITIKNHAIEIAHRLQTALHQIRVSIVMSDKTYMLSSNEAFDEN